MRRAPQAVVIGEGALARIHARPFLMKVPAAGVLRWRTARRASSTITACPDLAALDAALHRLRLVPLRRAQRS